MVVATSPVALAVSIAAVAASSAFVATVLRRRDDPTARPLIAVAGVLSGSAAAHLALVDLEPGRALLGVHSPPGALSGGLWLLLAFDITALLGVSWFLFALQYTGRDDGTARVASIAVAAVLVLLIGPHSRLAVSEDVVGFTTQVWNLVLGVAVVLAAALALIGLFFVLDSTFQHRAFPVGQTALHAAAVGSVLLLPFVATTVREPLTTPLSIAASSVLFTALVSRYRLLETLPVVSLVGRGRVVEEMSDGVVIVEADRRVRDLNPKAEALFGVDRATAVGQPLATVLPAAPDLPTAAGTGATDVTLESGRTVSVSVEETTARRGDVLGWLLVCRDVTERRRQARRLGVLTRVVAGVTTEQMRSVTDVTAAIDCGDCEPTRGGDRIRETATAVAVLVDNVRDIESRLSARTQSSNPSTDLREVVASLSAPASVDVSTAATTDPLWVAGDRELVAATLETLLAGAGSATLQVDAMAGSATVVIGPFDASDPDSLAALTVRVARTAAESAPWDVEADGNATPPVVRLSLPVLTDASRPDGEFA